MTVSYARDEAGVLNLAEAPTSVLVGPSMSTEYHLYALEWGPQRIDWFVDDELVHSFEFASDVIYEPEGLHPFRQPFRLKLSLSVGGLVEAPTPEDYPRQMRVRSLRVTRFE
jgi:beta-glucanase (GH16 family)